MAGAKIVLPVSFGDTTLPLVKDDPILNAGSMNLMEWVNEPSGVPVDQQVLTNVAYKELAALTGVAVPSLVPPKMEIVGGFAASDGKLERTPKGGLHVIMSQSTTTLGRGVRWMAGDTTKAFILANPGHAFAVTAWWRQTRGGLTPASSGAHTLRIAKRSSWAGALKALFYNQGWLAGAPGPMTGTPPYTATGVIPGQTSLIGQLAVGMNRLVGGGQAGWNGNSSSGTLVVPTSISDLDVGVNLGPTAGSDMNSASVQNTFPSLVLYRLYVEDLTVSGRTMAQFDAADAALYATAFGVGGRYYGDTIPTDPTTIP